MGAATIAREGLNGAAGGPSRVKSEVSPVPLAARREPWQCAHTEGCLEPAYTVAPIPLCEAHGLIYGNANADG
jgi:hypothetical protein